MMIDEYDDPNATIPDEQEITPAPLEINLDNYPVDIQPLVEPKGLGDGNTNQFYSERQALLWNQISDKRALDLPQGLKTAKESIDNLASKLSQIELQRSSSDLLRASKESLVHVADLAIEQMDKEGIDLVNQGSAYLTALDTVIASDPQLATSMAVVEVLAPYVPLTTKEVLAFKDYQNGVVGQRMQERNFLSFGVDNYLADLAATILPGRTLAGQMDVGNSPWFGSYFNRLKLWHDLPLREQRKNWPALEQELFDASGDNRLVYASLVIPFINKEDKVWAMVDSGADIIGIGTEIYGLKRGYDALKLLSRYQKVRSTANLAGNPDLAGRLVSAEVKRGNVEAIVEGHPVAPPTGVNPELVPDLGGPMQNTLVEELIANGVLIEGAGDVPVASISKLNDSEKAAAIERRRALVISRGELIGEQADDHGILFTLRRATTPKKPVTQVTAELKTLRKNIKGLKRDLAVALTDGDVEKVKVLQSTLDSSKEVEKQYKASLASVKELTTGGVRVTSVVAPGPVEEVKVHFHWTVDDVGFTNFSESPISLIAHALGSQETRLDKFMKGGTALGTFISAQQRGLLGHILRKEKQIRSTLKGSNPLTNLPRRLTGTNQVERVDAVLLKGDEMQITWSDATLIEGIETHRGLVKLDPVEIQAYKDTRDLYDSLWRMLNDTRRKDLQFSGQSAFRVNHVSKDGTIRPVNVYGRAGAQGDLSTQAIAGKDHLLNDVSSTHVIDAKSGNVVELATVPDLAKDLANGKKAFVELKEPFFQGDGSQYKHLLVDVIQGDKGKQAKQALEIPQEVLDYRQGYVPKLITNEVNFVVEERAPRIINGAKVRDLRPIRGFQNRAEADAFVNKSIADRLAKGTASTGTETPEWFVQDLTQEYRRNNSEKMQFINTNLFRGAFGGDRTDGVFKVGLEGEPGTRMSAFEGLRRYADFIARNAPMHEYKSAMIKRFLNSIKSASSGKKELEVPWDWTSTITMASTDPRYKGAVAMQDWMKATFAVPTSEERWFEGKMRLLSHGMDRLIYKDQLGNKRWAGSIPLALQRKLTSSRWAKNPIAAAKGLTFDMMLGMFNPAQLIVQSAGMMVPLSLNPITGIAALPQFLGIRALWSMTNIDDAAQVAKAMGLSEHEFRPMWNAFRRSGIPDSVIENADFGHYVTTQHGYYSVDFWSKIKETGRMFYTMGELNNRTFAWTVAYRRLMKENNWSKVAMLSDKQLTSINEEALRIGMNMTQANRAQFQTGVAALPTQFMQVTSKYLENLYHGMFGLEKGGQWTKAESWSSFATSTLAFGAAGWSVDELWKDYENSLTDPNGFYALDPVKNKDTLTAMRGGFMELMGLEVLGFTPDISDRIALGSGVQMIWDNILEPLATAVFEGDMAGLPKMLVGASYTMNTRVHNAFGAVTELLTTDIRTGNFTPQEILKAAVEVSTVASGMNNLVKAHVWAANNDLTNPTTGERMGMIPNGAEIQPEVLALKAIGIDPLDLEKYYIINRKGQEYEKLKQDISNQVAKELRALYLDTGLLENPATRKAAQARIAIWVQKLDANDRGAILNSALKILDEDTITEKLLSKIFHRLMQQEVGSPEAIRSAADYANIYNTDISTKD